MSKEIQSSAARTERPAGKVIQPAAENQSGAGGMPEMGLAIGNGTVQTQAAMLRQMNTAQGQATVARMGKVQGNQYVQRVMQATHPSLQMRKARDNKQIQRMDVGSLSSRFGGDKELEAVFQGAKTLQKGSRGIAVTKIQQALLDMGYQLPLFGVDGKFEDETARAVKAFQEAQTIAGSGVVDKATLEKMKAIYDTRQPNIDNAAFDPTNPTKGTRTLSSSDKTAVKNAMEPARGLEGRSATFVETVDGEKYGDEMKAGLKATMDAWHSDYETQKPLRADPTKLFSIDELKKPAVAAQEVVDALYGSYIEARGFDITENIEDQWEKEETRQAQLSPARRKRQAMALLWYAAKNYFAEINTKHSAVPTDPDEKAILDPIMESFVDTPEKITMLLEIDIAWPATEEAGKVNVQRFKGADEEENRLLMWKHFHTDIHEYLHACTHEKFMEYANNLGGVKRETLGEGFTEFFTENVRKNVAITPELRQKVEGPYYDEAQNTTPEIPRTYDNIEQAEQTISIVGIRNAQLAYFNGKVDKIGG